MVLIIVIMVECLSLKPQICLDHLYSHGTLHIRPMYATEIFKMKNEIFVLCLYVEKH